MFSKSIVLSDAFLDMPATTRCLYFTLSMLADDDGFVDSPKSIMRQCMATDDDMKILIAKYFLIPFDSGIVVIRHWRINNYLRADRYTETKHLDEKSSLVVEKNGAYRVEEKIQQELFEPQIISEQILLSKREESKSVSLIDREPKNDIEKIEKEYLQEYNELYESGFLRIEKPIINWAASRKITKEVLEKYGVDIVLEAVRKAKQDNFCIEKGFSLTTILSAGVFASLVNVSQRSSPKKVDLSAKIDMSDFVSL